MNRSRSTAVRIAIWSARVLVASVFLTAAVGKIVDPAGFSTTIANYQVFPHWSWNALALWVPMIEAVGALSLLTGWKRRGATVLLAGLTVSFLLLIASALWRGLDVNCGCFGTSAAADPLRWSDFVIDGLLLAAIVVAGSSPPRPAGSSHTSHS